ncbi:MAG: molybdenum cofactor guanylyltransferase [Bacteroidales bacterium]|nr:MAG: molybdenum cofactor guanylyltransferase [Bacteroidales bacterium]
MLKRSNFIIIGSTGNYTGKTEFACRLIENHSRKNQVIGVKVLTIDPSKGNCPVGIDRCDVKSSLVDDFNITEETILYPNKNTSRMLKSGAQRVFLLKVNKNSLEKGLNALLEIIPTNVMVICESNSLRKVLEPGLFLVIKDVADKAIKESCSEVIHFANKIIKFSKMNWNFPPNRILIKDDGWIIKEKATAIILAGGKSSRMGGEDKSLLPINDEPLIQSITKQLSEHFDEVIIGANDAEKYNFLNLRIIPDIERGKGPLMGIYSCLKASKSDVNFITACDIPVMNLSLIHSMINLSSNTDIVMPLSKENEQEPLFAVYRKRVAEKAERILQENGRRIIDLLKHSSYQYVDFDCGTWYQNLNHKEEYLKFVKNPDERDCNRV